MKKIKKWTTVLVLLQVAGVILIICGLYLNHQSLAPYSLIIPFLVGGLLLSLGSKVGHIMVLRHRVDTLEQQIRETLTKKK